MTCFRKILLTIALLMPLSFFHSVSAEPETEDAAKIEQRESGGKLLKFLFGDDDETDDPVDEETPKTIISDDEKSPEPPQVKAVSKEPIDENNASKETVATPLVQEPIESNEVVVVPSQEREGLAPPPGFNEAAPVNQGEITGSTKPAKEIPAKEIVVKQLPATSTLPSPTIVDAVTASEDVTSEALELSRLSEENPVVAIVEGDRIFWEDIMQAARKLPEQYQGQLETMFPLLLDRAIDLKLLAHAGADADVDNDKAVKRKLALAEESIIRDAFLEQQLDEMISESMLKDRYFALLRENITNAEIQARHILVDTRNEALALIIALENGANFPLLAKKFSRGPSAGKGGDLGWFRRKDMDPEFAASAFDLKKGEFTRTPVSTEFGWHVILLEDKRDVKQPTFESMRGEIKDIVSRDLVASMVRDLRKDADISVFPAK
ncbi:MAG: peptidylprolyl isomerase [Halopseudomonas aestusnigri]